MRDELGTDLARTSVAWRWRECLPLRSDLKVVIGDRVVGRSREVLLTWKTVSGVLLTRLGV